MKITLFYFITAFLSVSVFGQSDTTFSQTEWPVGMTVDQFNLKVKSTTKPLLVSFTADWCIVCKREKPVLDQVMAEVSGQVELLVIDMESNPLIAGYFEVDALPELILYKDGSLIFGKLGFQDKTQILEQLSPYIIRKNYHK